MSSTFVLGLEENALDSLTHAVEHFLAEERETDLKYTVLHIFHAVELFLKARLALVDSKLIYKNSEKTGEDDLTIGFFEVQKRLQSIDVNLSQRHLNNLDELRKLRNKIEHYRIQASREEIENYVGRAMDFLDLFIERELGISLKEKLTELDGDGETYRTLSMNWFSYLMRMAEAGISLHPKHQEHQILSCEVCGEEAIAIPDPTTTGDTAHCFSCQRHYDVDYCWRCEGVILSLGNSSTVRREQHEADGHWQLCECCQDWMVDQ